MILVKISENNMYIENIILGGTIEIPGPTGLVGPYGPLDPRG